MTAKQIDFIRTLVRERDCNALTNDQQEYLRRILFEGVDPTPAQASRIIEKLLSLRKLDGTVATPAPTVDVPAGRYAIVDDEDGRIRFFVVDRPTEGRWAGRVFVSEQASDEKFPVRGPRRNEVLAAIAAAGFEQAMIRYGHELGRCGNCGRTLTDETSRAMGIGPDCAAKLGIDRTPASERARAEAARRVRGDADEDRSEPYSTPTSDLEISGDEYGAFEASRTTAPPAGAGADLRGAETGEGPDTSPAPAAPQNSSYGLLRAAAGRPDPAKALGWRERKAAVAAQQGREAKADRPCSQNRQTPGTDIFGAPLS